MEKYSKEWKLKQGIWIQDHKNYSGEKIYKIHYIENDTEYSKGEYFTQKEASDALRASRAAAALGRIGGSAKTEAKKASSRENGKLGGRPREKQSIISALNSGADPADFGFDCRADDGQGNEYWCKNQGAIVVRLNCYTDPEIGNKTWDDDVSGWENQ